MKTGQEIRSGVWTCDSRAKAYSARTWAVTTALALALCGSVAMAEGATLVSDKDDYAPGETVWLTGEGFWPGELIDLSISIDDPENDIHIADYAWVQFNAELDGSFVATYVVPSEALDMTLTATALGIESGLVAVAVFTDSHGTHNINFATSGLPAEVSITISGSRTNPGHNVASYSVTFSSPGPSANTGAQAGGGDSTVTYNGFPPVVVVGADTYNLVSTSPASGFATGAAGGSTTVLATYEKAPGDDIECPENSAPSISADDLDLGQLVGCLVDGSFEVTVGIDVDDFNVNASDPDGDPVIVSLDVSEVTLVGPGLASVTVTLTATDDPSDRNVDGCDALEPLSTSIEVEVSAQVIYNFVGFHKPLDNNKATIVKKGSTVPVKFNLVDGCGAEICTGSQNISVFLSQNCTPEGEVVVNDAGSSNDNGVLFRYSGECGDGQWIYNLQTKVGYSAGATYKIRATLDDGTTHDVHIAIK